MSFVAAVNTGWLNVSHVDSLLSFIIRNAGAFQFYRPLYILVDFQFHYLGCRDDIPHYFFILKIFVLHHCFFLAPEKRASSNWKFQTELILESAHSLNSVIWIAIQFLPSCRTERTCHFWKQLFIGEFESFPNKICLCYDIV